MVEQNGVVNIKSPSVHALEVWQKTDEKLMRKVKIFLSVYYNISDCLILQTAQFRFYSSSNIYFKFNIHSKQNLENRDSKAARESWLPKQLNKFLLCLEKIQVIDKLKLSINLQ